MATREIKFRLWDKESKQLITQNPVMSSSAFALDPLGGLWKTDGSGLYQGNNYDLMQYTGLEDKNGAEIYEGDIVKFQLIARPAETYVVEWGHFGFTYKKPGDDGDHYLQQAYLEVIGNIYENEDLL